MAFLLNAPLDRAITLTPTDDTSPPAPQPGAIFSVNCTVAGDVSVDLSSGDQYVFHAEVGQSYLPLSVQRVNSTGTTATAVFANLL